MADHDYILNKARNYCAYQERCLEEVKTKLKAWKVQSRSMDKILGDLLKDDFINEERFARIYSSGKFRNNHWGKNKIIYELKKRKIPDLFIEIGLQEIDEEDYNKTLKYLIKRKNKEIRDENLYSRKRKLINYAKTKGYRFAHVENIIDDMLA